MKKILLTPRHSVVLIALCALAIGNTCSAKQHDLVPPPDKPATRASEPIQACHRKVIENDLKPFVGKDCLLDVKRGDLTGNGSMDALLVLDSPSVASTALGQGPTRTIVLLVRGTDGRLHEASRNSMLVPCAHCGGLYGDPYSYTQAGIGKFTVVTEGGSRDHWSNKYTFIYSKKQHTWLLEKFISKARDQLTGKSKSIDLTAKKFGQIDFSKTDPQDLPKAELP
ncbi:hypothetical protein [Dyella sp. A6]|uniref:hypothetical protein n=1 Tax=Dyella aluminiiresistens TaxID=3069105 RepID=UPI002E79D023|nr:hypothetical protein [Dyella sp. A6]